MPMFPGKIKKQNKKNKKRSEKMSCILSADVKKRSRTTEAKKYMLKH
jgi:hypothetical protein